MARSRRPKLPETQAELDEFYDERRFSIPSVEEVVEEMRVDVDPAMVGPDKTGTGTHCSDCGAPQYETPSGVTCRNGHGGSPALEDTRPAIPAFEGAVIHRHAAAVNPFVDQLLDRVLNVDFDVTNAGEVIERPASRRAPMVVRTTEEIPDAFGGAIGFTGHSKVKQVRAKREEPAAPPAERLRFVPIETRALVETDDPEDMIAARVPLDGCIVKVAPSIKASERETFDGAGIRAGLLALGAARVLLAPRIVPDVRATKRVEVEHRTQSPAEIATEWFEREVAGLSEEDRRAAVTEALAVLEDAGVR